MSDETHDLDELIHPPHHRAEIVFAVASFLVAVFLATQWSTQTSWGSGRPITRQPGLWPLIAVVGMLLFGAGELVACVLCNLRNGGGDALAEVWHWVKSTEYVLWCLVQVAATPYVGYFPATMIFMTVLALRLGYRGRVVALSPLIAIGIVLLFKTFLSVRIPGGEICDIFPQALRNFLIIQFCGARVWTHSSRPSGSSRSGKSSWRFWWARSAASSLAPFPESARRWRSPSCCRRHSAWSRSSA